MMRNDASYGRMRFLGVKLGCRLSKRWSSIWHLTANKMFTNKTGCSTRSKSKIFKSSKITQNYNFLSTHQNHLFCKNLKIVKIQSSKVIRSNKLLFYVMIIKNGLFLVKMAFSARPIVFSLKLQFLQKNLKLTTLGKNVSNWLRLSSNAPKRSFATKFS